jgi:hypothetical protein
VYGFCYYHYWFNGMRLLDRPLTEMLATGRPDSPFCLCWANENWTRRWDGRDGEVLVAQHYGLEDDRRHIQWLAAALRDERYIRVDGKPLLLVYRVGRLPSPLRTAMVWREEARRLGLGDLFLACVESFPDERVDPTRIGFDAAVEFQPDWSNLGEPALLGPEGLRVFDYEAVVRRMGERAPASYRRFPCVTPGFDNTPRVGERGIAIRGSSPDRYGRWLGQALAGLPAGPVDQRLVFVNAWNEWAEGAYLEPCRRWAREYLEVTGRTVAAASARPTLTAGPRTPVVVRPVPARLSVSMPTYNGARFVGPAIRSVLAQDGVDLHLTVVDDASTDGTAEVVRSIRDPRLTWVRNPVRLGLVGNWNRCLEMATGDYVCLFHQDDVMAPGNLASKVAALDQAPTAGLVYSSASQIGPDGELLSPWWDEPPRAEDDGVRSGLDWVQGMLAGPNRVCCPTVVVRRECYQRLGGFDPRLPFTADWEMWMRVALFYDVVYLAAPLVAYRRHDANETLAFQGLAAVEHAYRAKALLLDTHGARLADAPGVRAAVARRAADEALTLARDAYRHDRATEGVQGLRLAAEVLGPATGGSASRDTLDWMVKAVDAAWRGVPAGADPSAGSGDPDRLDLERALREARTEVIALRRSLSWRITGPLRRTYDWLARLGAPLRRARPGPGSRRGSWHTMGEP